MVMILILAAGVGVGIVVAEVGERIGVPYVVRLALAGVIGWLMGVGVVGMGWV